MCRPNTKGGVDLWICDAVVRRDFYDRYRARFGLKVLSNQAVFTQLTYSVRNSIYRHVLELTSKERRAS